ncbi:MAG: Rne/Rng family ribonuclease [Myxococcales bacterium]|nr:Rne/Rng family ribonuclease [Myxococcales bacterium]
MSAQLIINASESETRVSLLEHGSAAEIYIERQADRGVVGNIYRGKVSRVLPGMQAAFVDIGLERSGFLYVNDAIPQEAAQNENGFDRSNTDMHQQQELLDAPYENRRQEPRQNIAEVLKNGQDIVVQVAKEPFGTKGARLTTHLSIPGRYLVYMPTFKHTGISRRIEDEGERQRLSDIVEKYSGPKDGFIVRTVAEGIDDNTLKREAAILKKVWLDIEKKSKKGPTPKTLMEDLDLVLRSIRDLLSEDVREIITDNADDVDRIKEFLKSFKDSNEIKVLPYTSPEPIFDHYGIEVEIERALERRVWLKSGGYIVIDQAEALTVIDVNSGRFVGKSSLEDTVTQINLEAVREIAYQLRLRNIGGIIIIDFIDMAVLENQEKVLGSLQEALSRDKAKTTIVRLSDLGLVEMTRKRVRESLGATLTEQCGYCKGRGSIKSALTVAHEILRAAQRSLSRKWGATVLINMEAGIADYLYEEQADAIEEIETKNKCKVIPVARQGYHREHFEVVISQNKEES